MEYVRCDLCGADSPTFLFERTDRFSGEKFRYVRCSECGLIYLSPRPSVSDLPSYYPERYEAYQRSDAMMSISRWRRRHAAGILRRFIAGYHQEGRLLDVGCATGWFLEEMRAHGWDVEGVEVSARAAAIAREEYGLKVFNSTLAEFEAPENAFDVATLWDVLEHLPSPKAALEKINDLLASGRHLVFSIPNLQSFDAQLFGQRWIGWDAPRHLHLFSRSVVDRLLAETGFEIERTRCLLGGPGAFVLSWHFWVREKFGSDGAMSELLQRASGLFPYLLWPYKELSYAVNRGPVITIVARKTRSL
jgi:SAM-dependent methyltransferase